MSSLLYQCNIVSLLRAISDVLAPPTGLEIEHFNSTHDNLTWTGPYGLDLTTLLGYNMAHLGLLVVADKTHTDNC